MRHLFFCVLQFASDYNFGYFWFLGNYCSILGFLDRDVGSSALNGCTCCLMWSSLSGIVVCMYVCYSFVQSLRVFVV